MDDSSKLEKRADTKSVGTLSLVFILFFAIPFIASFLFGYETVVYYVASLLLLMLTWLVYRLEGRNLSELGLSLKPLNIYLFPIGILIGFLFFCVLFSLQMLNSGIRLELNPNVDYPMMAGGAFLLFPAVFGEELIFRGYCFKETVGRAGPLKANLIFALIYMVWHWIALDAWGNYGLMLGLVTTGFGHLLFSTALLKSGSLYFPIGIHLGNNWASHNLFSASTGGMNAKASNDTLFIFTEPVQDFSKFHSLTSYAITTTCFLIFIMIIRKSAKSVGN